MAKKLKGEPGHVVAIIGDGAFTGGMVYEGMNNIGKLDNLLVILNDNKMSISHNVGALASYLGHLRTTNGYFTAKENVNSFLNGVPVIGAPIKSALQNSKKAIRRAMYHSTMLRIWGFTILDSSTATTSRNWNAFSRLSVLSPGRHCSMS